MYDNYNPFLDRKERPELLEVERFFFRYCYRTKKAEETLSRFLDFLKGKVVKNVAIRLDLDDNGKKVSQVLYILKTSDDAIITDNRRSLPARKLYNITESFIFNTVEICPLATLVSTIRLDDGMYNVLYSEYGSPL